MDASTTSELHPVASATEAFVGLEAQFGAKNYRPVPVVVETAWSGTSRAANTST